MFFKRRYNRHYLRWILLWSVIILCCSYAEEEKEEEEGANESKVEETSSETRPGSPHIIFILADDLVHSSFADFYDRNVIFFKWF